MVPLFLEHHLFHLVLWLRWLHLDLRYRLLRRFRLVRLYLMVRLCHSVLPDPLFRLDRIYHSVL